ncbi:MAG: acyl-CoA dehydratase activase [Bacillota bacterium]|uniref:acyl-CoA dehydratase activase n=1 Tax=Desulfurispora thermophila TaxID=265470 RepID=UPI00037A0625|nr:acyl-CoA dehydratase activase [Desulfurispora thermophila]
MKGFLGIDVGSVSTNLVFLDDDRVVQHVLYLRTQGRPLQTLQEGLKKLSRLLPPKTVVRGVGTTGSGRHLAGVMVGADVIKNEITTHAVAASAAVPGVQTVLEIGGQDSKLIILRHGLVVDFAMNTVCAAGTGSFLDQQAARLNLPVDQFGELALSATSPVRIAGRCAVFAESDMIHKQQMGHSLSDIVAGLCRALVRNYLNNVAKGKPLLPPIVFQGGVAANAGMRQAFAEILGQEIIVPPNYHVMGAVGAALLAAEHALSGVPSRFKGFKVAQHSFATGGFSCHGCPNNCEIVEIREEGQIIARWGDRCGKWSQELDSGCGEVEKIS